MLVAAAALVVILAIKTQHNIDKQKELNIDQKKKKFYLA